MAHSWTWSSSTPAGSAVIREGDDRIRETKLGVQERMKLEHQWAVDTDVDGMHAFASDLSKSTGILTNLETFIGSAGGQTITIDPDGSGIVAGKPYFIMKNDSSADPLTVSLDSGHWNNISTAEHTFYPGSSADIVLANRGDYIWGISDGTDFWIFGIRRSGLRILTAAATIDEFDDIVLCDGTGVVVSVTLPAANLVEGKIFHIKAINIDNTITITGTVDGVANPTIDTLEDNWMIASNGTDYERLNPHTIANGSITAVKLDLTGTQSSIVLGATGGTYTIPKGLYYFSSVSNIIFDFQVNMNGTWEFGTRAAVSGVGSVIGMHWSDGTNMRLVNASAGASNTVRVFKRD